MPVVLCGGKRPLKGRSCAFHYLFILCQNPRHSRKPHSVITNQTCKPYLPLRFLLRLLDVVVHERHKFIQVSYIVLLLLNLKVSTNINATQPSSPPPTISTFSPLTSSHQYHPIQPEFSMEKHSPAVSAFFTACSEQGDQAAQKVSAALEENITLLYARNAEGCTPLHIAAHGCSAEVLQTLFDVQGRIGETHAVHFANAVDYAGRTPLYTLLESLKTKGTDRCTTTLATVLRNSGVAQYATRIPPSQKRICDIVTLCRDTPHLQTFLESVYPPKERLPEENQQSLGPHTDLSEVGMVKGYATSFDMVGLGSTAMLSRLSATHLNDCEAIVTGVVKDKQRFKVLILELPDEFEGEEEGEGEVPASTVAIGKEYSIRLANLDFFNKFKLNEVLSCTEESSFPQIYAKNTPVLLRKRYVATLAPGSSFRWDMKHLRLVQSYNKKTGKYTVQNVDGSDAADIAAADVLLPPVEVYIELVRNVYGWRDDCLRQLLSAHYGDQDIQFDVGTLMRLNEEWRPALSEDVLVFDGRDETSPQRYLLVQNMQHNLWGADHFHHPVTLSYILSCMRHSKLFGEEVTSTYTQKTLIGFTRPTDEEAEKMLGRRPDWAKEALLVAQYVDRSEARIMKPGRSISKFGRRKSRWYSYIDENKTLARYRDLAQPVAANVDAVDRFIHLAERNRRFHMLSFPPNLPAADDAIDRVIQLRGVRRALLEGHLPPSPDVLEDLGLSCYYGDANLPQHMVDELASQGRQANDRAAAALLLMYGFRSAGDTMLPEDCEESEEYSAPTSSDASTCEDDDDWEEEEEGEEGGEEESEEYFGERHFNPADQID